MRKFKSYILLLMASLSLMVACDDDDPIDAFKPVPGVDEIEGTEIGVFKGKAIIGVANNLPDTLYQRVYVSSDTKSDNLIFRMENVYAGRMDLGKVVFHTNKVTKAKDNSLRFTINQDAGFELEDIEFVSIKGEGVLTDKSLVLSYELKPIFAPTVTIDMPSCRKLLRPESDTIAIHELSFSDDFVVVQPKIDNEKRTINVWVQDSLRDTTSFALHVNDVLLSVGARSEKPLDSVVIYGGTKSYIPIWAPDTIAKSIYTLQVTYLGTDEYLMGTWADTLGYPRCVGWSSSNETLMKLQDSLGYTYPKFPVTGTSLPDSTGGEVTVETISLGTPEGTYNYPGLFFKGSWMRDSLRRVSLDSMRVGDVYNRKEPKYLRFDYEYSSSAMSSFNDTIFSDKLVNGVVVPDTIIVTNPRTDSCAIHAYLCKVNGSGDPVTFKNILENDPRIVAKCVFNGPVTNGFVRMKVPFEYKDRYMVNSFYRLVVYISASKDLKKTPFAGSKVTVKNFDVSYVSYLPRN